MKDLRALRKRKALAIAPQWYQYRRKSDDLLQWLDDIERSVAELPDPPKEQRVKVGSAESPVRPIHLNTCRNAYMYTYVLSLSPSLTQSTIQEIVRTCTLKAMSTKAY